MSIRAMTKRRLVARAAIGLIALLALIQPVPYGHSHANPPVTRAARWDSAQTAKLVAGACNDCHSNLTKWRWYSSIAPGSWLIQNDVNGGRNNLNFSRWDQPQPSIDEVVEQIRGGGMPPLQYKLIHADARLSKAERDKLVRGLEATYAVDPPGGG
jgi:mono/diheme cytochrome c family protein